MSSQLIVLGFDDTLAAFQVRNKLIDLQKAHLIQLADAAVAVRNPKGHLQIKQIVDLTAQGALGGAFWGMLGGMLFWLPLLGMAVGTLMGALAGSLGQYGIEESFITEVSSSIGPGQSALFLLVSNATTDRVIEEIAPWNPRLLRTSLSHAQENKLRESFSDDGMEDHLAHATIGSIAAR